MEKEYLWVVYSDHNELLCICKTKETAQKKYWKWAYGSEYVDTDILKEAIYHADLHITQQEFINE